MSTACTLPQVTVLQNKHTEATRPIYVLQNKPVATKVSINCFFYTGLGGLRTDNQYKSS